MEMFLTLHHRFTTIGSWLAAFFRPKAFSAQQPQLPGDGSNDWDVTERSRVMGNPKHICDICMCVCINIYTYT